MRCAASGEPQRYHERERAACDAPHDCVFGLIPRHFSLLSITELNGLVLQPYFEPQLGGKLEWIEAKKACRVVQRKESADIDDEASITTHFDWLIDRAIAFDKVFGPLVKKFKDE